MRNFILSKTVISYSIFHVIAHFVLSVLLVISTSFTSKNRLHLQNHNENRTNFLHMQTYFMCELKFHIHKTFTYNFAKKNINSAKNLKLNLHFIYKKPERRVTITHP